MLRVIRNDLVLNKLAFFFIFMLLNLSLVVAAGQQFFHRPISFKMGIAAALIMTLPILLRHVKYPGLVLYRSLPLTRTAFVLGRYGSLSIVGILTILYALAFQSAIHFFGGAYRWFTMQIDPGYASEHSIIARVLALALAVGFLVPFEIRESVVWSTLVRYALVWIVWGRVVNWLMALSLKATFFFGFGRWAFFALGILVILMFGSVKISVWVCSRKEL